MLKKLKNYLPTEFFTAIRDKSSAVNIPKILILFMKWFNNIQSHSKDVAATLLVEVSAHDWATIIWQSRIFARIKNDWLKIIWAGTCSYTLFYNCNLWLTFNPYRIHRQSVTLLIFKFKMGHKENSISVCLLHQKINFLQWPKKCHRIILSAIYDKILLSLALLANFEK